MVFQGFFIVLELPIAVAYLAQIPRIISFEFVGAEMIIQGTFKITQLQIAPARIAQVPGILLAFGASVHAEVVFESLLEAPQRRKAPTDIFEQPVVIGGNGISFFVVFEGIFQILQFSKAKSQLLHQVLMLVVYLFGFLKILYGLFYIALVFVMQAYFSECIKILRILIVARH